MTPQEPPVTASTLQAWVAGIARQQPASGRWEFRATHANAAAAAHRLRSHGYAVKHTTINPYQVIDYARGVNARIP